MNYEIYPKDFETSFFDEFKFSCGHLNVCEQII